jgi:hypothetical protein
VRVCLGQAIPAQGGRKALPKGCQQIEGDDVTALLQGQEGLWQFSLDRERNHQRFLTAMAMKLAAEDPIGSPARIARLRTAAGRGLRIDGDPMTLLRTAGQLKNPELIGLTEPLFNSRNDGEIIDSAEWKSLYQAIRDDQVAKWAAANPSYLTK